MTVNKPLASEGLEPTYRKGGECWSEDTGRGSSRAFLGTLSLKFVLETEEKTRELLWADQEGLYSRIHTSGAPGTALESPTKPTSGSPSSPVQEPPLRASSHKALGVEYFYMGGGGGSRAYEGRTTQASSSAHCLHCGHSLAPFCGIHQASWDTMSSAL